MSSRANTAPIDLEHFLAIYSYICSGVDLLPQEVIYFIAGYDMNFMNVDDKLLHEISEEYMGGYGNIFTLVTIPKYICRNMQMLNEMGHHEIKQAMEYNQIKTMESFRNGTYFVTYGGFTRDVDFLGNKFTNLKPQFLKKLCEILDHAEFEIARINELDREYERQRKIDQMEGKNELPY